MSPIVNCIRCGFNRDLNHFELFISEFPEVPMSNPTYRIKPSTLQEDTAAFAALKNIPSYTPANANYALDKVQTVADAMTAKQDAETQQKAALDAARDDATSAEWDFHNALLGVKEQVKAQFGGDSNEWQALGLTKKSEKARPSAKAAPTPPAK
jgi:hypothetical protein